MQIPRPEDMVGRKDRGAGAPGENMTLPAGDKHQAIVEVEGHRADDGAASQLSGQVRDLLNQGYESVLLNVGQLTYVDSVLLSALVQAHISAIRRGARIGLLHATKRLRDALAITRLNKVIEIVEDDTSRQS